MTQKLLAAGLLAVGACLAIAQQIGITTHTKADLDHEFSALLEAAHKSGLASKILDDHGPSRVVLVARTQTGEAELHENWADEFLVNSGTITVEVGGEMAGKHSTEKGEFRGTGLTGNIKKYKLGPGDILHIPIGVPHWTTLEPNTSATYFSFKEK